MICSICKKGETSVVDSRPTEKMALLYVEEDYVFVELDLQHLKEFSIEKLWL